MTVPLDKQKLCNRHCVKSVRIRSFSGPYFPAFGLNRERYGISLRIQTECGKIRNSKTSNIDTFHAVRTISHWSENLRMAPERNFRFCRKCKHPRGEESMSNCEIYFLFFSEITQTILKIFS